MRLDVGLVGATRIAERAVLAPSTRHDDVTVRAVAASDRRRAEDFAGRNGIERVHEDYASLVRDPGLDVVYVSLHNSAHHPWVLRAAEHGKHVVVEKPLCLNHEQFAEIAETAARHGVRVVEAVPTAGHPWQAAVRAMREAGTYGELRSVHTDLRFGTPADGGYRTRPELGGGVFLDVASYWLQALQATVGLGGATGAGRSDFDGPGGADRSFRATLRWASGTEATLDCAVGDGHRADLVFVFEEASVRLRGLLRPTVAPLPLNLAVRHASGTTRVRSFPAVGYYDRQLDRIRDHLLGDSGGWGGELAAAGPRISLMAEIHDSARREAGVPLTSGAP